MQPAGQQEHARVMVLQARKMLTNALAAFDGSSDEAKAILDALRPLVKSFPAQHSAPLIPAQLMQLMNSRPQ
jgi:hypothetical protein